MAAANIQYIISEGTGKEFQIVSMQKYPCLEIARLSIHADDRGGNISQHKIQIKFSMIILHNNGKGQNYNFIVVCRHVYCSFCQNFRYFLLRVFAKLKKGSAVTVTYQERSNPKNV